MRARLEKIPIARDVPSQSKPGIGVDSAKRALEAHVEAHVRSVLYLTDRLPMDVSSDTVAESFCNGL